MKQYYRYVEYHYLNGGVRLQLMKYAVIKETPKGVVLDDCGQRRFVLHDSIKKFAYPFIDDAQESFKRRKMRQITILEARLRRAKLALEAAEIDLFQGENYKPSLLIFTS